MKKLATFLLVFTLSVCALFVGCNKDPLVLKESDNFVVITADTSEDLTLIEYINSLDEYKDMFVIENGMVTSIDGVSNTANWSHSWMIYTSDSEMANTGWGEVEYKGNVYGSAILGASELKVKNGCLYIFVYQSFNL
ncbi:MAG: hypothetical protein IKA54_04435 [Clostridia bacterium]|nr:hypothetical protein [Clostridia bacterium]